MLDGQIMKFEVVRRLSAQRPTRRRVDCCAIGKCDGVRQLALRRKVGRNVFVKGGEALKFKAGRLMGIENGYWLFEAITNGLDGRGKVGVAGDECKGVGGVGHCVHQHFRCDVDIGTFFFQFDNGCQMVRGLVAALARFLVKGHQSFGLLVESFDESDARECRQGLPIVVLVQFGLRIRRIGFRLGCEIFDGGYVMLRTDKGLCEVDEIQPTIGLVLEKSVEKIEAVNVNNGFDHGRSWKMLRPGLLPALRRIGSASAGGSNPSRGSAMIVSFSADDYNGVNWVKENERTINDVA